MVRAAIARPVDVAPDGENRFTAQTGPAGQHDRQVVEATQVLAQVIVAAAKRFPEKSVRSVYAVFARAVMVGAGPVDLEIDVVGEAVRRPPRSRRPSRTGSAASR